MRPASIVFAGHIASLCACQKLGPVELTRTVTFSSTGGRLIRWSCLRVHNIGMGNKLGNPEGRGGMPYENVAHGGTARPPFFQTFGVNIRSGRVRAHAARRSSSVGNNMCSDRGHTVARARGTPTATASARTRERLEKVVMTSRVVSEAWRRRTGRNPAVLDGNTCIECAYTM